MIFMVAAINPLVLRLIQSRITLDERLLIVDLQMMQAVLWGEVSIVDAERRLLANALLDFSNERFILLSELCTSLEFHLFLRLHNQVRQEFH